MPRKKNMNMKNILFWIFAGVIIITVMSLLQSPNLTKREVNFSQFMSDVEANRIE